MNKNVDRIAKIIHDAWTEWTKSLSDIEDFDQLILQADQWEKLQIPYEKLSKETKEKDRKLARNIIECINMENDKATIDADDLDQIFLSLAFAECYMQEAKVTIDNLNVLIDEVYKVKDRYFLKKFEEG